MMLLNSKQATRRSPTMFSRWGIAGVFSVLASVFSTNIAIAADTSIKGSVVIDSWRNDDAVWKNTIIPAFNQHYPNIKVEYRAPADPSTFNTQLSENLAAGTAGDLIACRPFDASLSLFKQGYFSDITEISGMENFPSFALGPWQTDSGAQTFCLPMASVIHGFFYNKAVFKELGIDAPKTTAQFTQVLERVKQNGKYIPLAMGTKDKWEAATMGFQNIGPNHWKGEDGRLALIRGTERFSDAAYQQTFAQLASWQSYLGKGYQQRGYNDAIALFKSGKAAIFPTGSWDISTFDKSIELGVLRPPVEKANGECYFSDHTDLGMGLNSKAKDDPAANAFLNWMTTAEFAELMTNALPGFFSLSNHFFDVKNPIAAEMMGWRDECDSTIRNSAQILSRGKPELENQLWQTSADVINGSITPAQAAQTIQQGLVTWYEPQRNAKSALVCQ
ncbi:ABC transporter substrate-binding protein [Photobacterium sanguinicancri]|nr:ABC transporter substrate-binding protein [Photobacterium sanguinicancri]MDO6498121.1 ABC transporter substrate-binding protein [Photobacterium sanguinicancri]